MEKSLYTAAVTGNTGFLSEAREREIETGNWDEHLVSKTPQNNNIIHIASLHGHFDFIQNVLTLLNLCALNLISEKNDDGDTPLHIASKKGYVGIVQLLVGYSNKMNVGGPATMVDHDGEIEVAEDGDHQGLSNSKDCPQLKRIWRVANKEGNTPLHEALIYGRVEVARYLVELDDHLTALVNNHKETPLHLAIKHNFEDDKQLVTEAIELMNKQHPSLTYKASKCLTKEESLSMIQLLIHKIKSNVEVLYMRDEDGLTPLLRAATVSNIPAIQAIITEFPETAEIRDFDGQTILHLVKIKMYDEEARTFMEIPEIVCLKDQRDNLGNTPAFVVVKDIIEKHQSKMKFEVGLLKALLVSSANFTIKNNKGISAVALIQQHKSIFSNIFEVQRNEELEAVIKSICSTIYEDEEIPEIRKAIQNADFLYLTERIDKLGHDLPYYGCLGGGNILHGVLKALNTNTKTDETKVDDIDDNRALLNFIDKVLKKFPSLLYQADDVGDTLLHIMVRGYEITPTFLNQIMEYFETYKRNLTSDEELLCTPWMVKNAEGNTPFHEALLHSPSADEITSWLFDHHDTSVFELVNHQKQTPLHVLCRTEAKVKECEKVTEKVVKAYEFAAYIRDASGLTPILRAAQTGNITQVEIICQICPGSAQLRDNKGRIFWHDIDLSKVSRKNEKCAIHELLNNEPIKQLFNVKDVEGNTPIKVAINMRNYHLLKTLKPYPDVYVEVEHILGDGYFENNLLLKTISFARIFPFKTEQIIWEILKEVPRKSIFGVSESEISGYSQTLGVIAALLATIAFTAAFSVPGGFRQGHEYLNKNRTSVPFTITPSGEPDNSNITSDLIGTPVLLGTDLVPFLVRASYWLFMAADIVTMCLSTFVLYCLLWMMKNDRMKMVLIDMSIFTIQICFYTTLTTFMMGVFATTLLVDSSLAYLTLFVCSFLMLFMNRWLVPIKYIFLVFSVVYEVSIQALERYSHVRLSPFSTLETKTL